MIETPTIEPATETITETIKPLAAPAPREFSRHTFFTNYKNIDSFCDAVIRQLIIIDSAHLKELGKNPIAQLKHKLGAPMHTHDGKTDMNKIIMNFHELYPDINLIVYTHDSKTLHLIPIQSDEFTADKANPRKQFTISLVQHDDRYSPLISRVNAKPISQTEKLICVTPIQQDTDNKLHPQFLYQVDVALVSRIEELMKNIRPLEHQEKTTSFTA